MGKNTYASYMEQRELRAGRWVSTHPKCQHGQRSGYSRYGCRCEPCCFAEHVYRDSLKGQPIPDELHGTIAGYRRGCQQPCCGNAMRAYDAARGTSPARLGLAKPPMPRLPARSELAALMWLKFDRATNRWITTAPHARHGGWAAYINLGCRCQQCESAVPHGTLRGYTAFRCRCGECGDAQHAYYLAHAGQGRRRLRNFDREQRNPR